MNNKLLNGNDRAASLCFTPHLHSASAVVPFEIHHSRCSNNFAAGMQNYFLYSLLTVTVHLILLVKLTQQC